MANESLKLQYQQPTGGSLDIEVVVNVEGLAELEEAFTEGDKRCVRKFLKQVETKAAGVLRRALSEEAPYFHGDLSEDIHIMTAASTSNGALTVRIGPSKDTFYGLIQEFGAPSINVPAQHWMELTAKEHQDKVLEAYINALNEGLQDMKK